MTGGRPFGVTGVLMGLLALVAALHLPGAAHPQLASGRVEGGCVPEGRRAVAMPRGAWEECVRRPPPGTSPGLRPLPVRGGNPLPLRSCPDGRDHARAR